MKIILGSDAAAELHDPGNFTAFSIAAPADLPAGELGSLVRRSGIGALDDDGSHVHVGIEAIRALAAGRTDGGWDAGFDAMISYARTKGWVDDAADTVRAHVDRR